MTPHQEHLANRGDILLTYADSLGIIVPKRLREHIGSRVASTRMLGWKWLQDAEAHVAARHLTKHLSKRGCECGALLLDARGAAE